MRFKATVPAFEVTIYGDGMLLGGVAEHRSSPFLLLENAEKWADTVVEINRGAGRKILGVKFKTVRAPMDWTV